jgi:RHS repeat-associated protein
VSPIVPDRTVNTGSNVQSHSYVYDVLGNVTQRLDGATGRDERFSFADGSDGYDGLNRLRVQRVIGGATVTVAYDALGNITSKSDVGSYAYGQNAGPHAVTSAGGNSYSYDANGNMTSGAGRTLEWTSFNQLRKVTQGGLNSEFWFGAGHERVLQQESNNTKTVYVGALYEVVTNPDGLTELKHYLMTPLGRTAVRTVRMNGKVETRYFHQDALGSIAAVTDEWGRVEKRYTFDAWGKRVNTLDTHSSSGGKVTRGFTDHEMLDDFGLIHMNGRVYDPVLGRFLSADSYVQDAGDSQTFNRYSYCGNNPVNATDPSGHFSLGDAAKIVAVVAAGILTAGAAMYGYAILMGGSFVGGFAGALSSVGLAAGWGGGWAIAAGAGFGFGSGFAASLLNGGSIGDAFKAGVIGGVVGGISAGIAGKIGDFADDNGWFKGAGQNLAHGALQGSLTEATGGQFRHGFYAGFFSSAAAGQIQGAFPNRLAAQTAAAAVVGGTASVVGGGKFANGAVSGAFTYLFNHAAHDEDEEQQTRDDARTVRHYINDYIKKNGWAPIPLTEDQRNVMLADSALEIRDAHFEEDNSITYNFRLRKADSEFYPYAAHSFIIDGITWDGGVINYYFFGMAEASRGTNSPKMAAFSLAFKNRVWNTGKALIYADIGRLNKVSAGDYWAAVGYTYYEMHGGNKR